MSILSKLPDPVPEDAGRGQNAAVSDDLPSEGVGIHHSVPDSVRRLWTEDRNPVFAELQKAEEKWRVYSDAELLAEAKKPNADTRVLVRIIYKGCPREYLFHRSLTMGEVEEQVKDDYELVGYQRQELVLEYRARAYDKSVTLGSLVDQMKPLDQFGRRWFWLLPLSDLYVKKRVKEVPDRV